MESQLLYDITMKKILLLSSFILTLFTCSEALEFNTPSFQGEKETEFWSATSFNAIAKSNGSIEITGVSRDDVVTLNIPSLFSGTYTLGVSDSSNATFQTLNQPIYSTDNSGDGEIIIEEYNIETQTITGRFNFNAVSENGDIVNFIKGVFYRVPITLFEEIVAANQLNASVDNTELDINEIMIDVDDLDVIEVKGTSTDGTFIKLVIPETTNVGSYNLNNQSDSGTSAQYGFSNGTTSNSQFGTLFILEHDRIINRIKGTFTFNTLQPNSVEVNNGSFTVFY